MKKITFTMKDSVYVNNGGSVFEENNNPKKPSLWKRIISFIKKLFLITSLIFSTNVLSQDYKVVDLGLYPIMNYKGYIIEYDNGALNRVRLDRFLGLTKANKIVSVDQLLEYYAVQGWDLVDIKVQGLGANLILKREDEDRN